MDSGEETAEEGTKVTGTAELTVLDMVLCVKRGRKRRGKYESKVKKECKW